MKKGLEGQQNKTYGKEKPTSWGEKRAQQSEKNCKEINTVT
jgi:hypothetical protein